jgi:glutathione S-transferase
MKLYEFDGFPSPRRIRVFLAEKGIDGVESVQVDVPGGEARRQPFRSKNPLGEVPVLELDDGTCIGETTAISRYFEELHPEPALFGATTTEKALVEMWQRRLESGLMSAVLAYFHHATAGLGPLETYQNRDWGENNRARAVATMQLLDKQLEGRSFVVGDSFSIADITGLCAMDFADYCKIGVPPDLTNLRAWHHRVSSRPSAAA